MDAAAVNALRRKAELLKELEEIELFLKLRDKFVRGTNVEQSPAPLNMVVSRPAKAAVDAWMAHGRLARKRGRPADFADLMENLIRETGHPMNRPELADKLEFRGVEIPSDDKPRYLGTILWRHSNRFRNLPGFGYWLIGEPYSPANYDPTTDTEAARLLNSEPAFVEKPPEQGDENDH